MAFLEWRRFSFFDVCNNVDNGKIAECLQDINVTVATSGNSHVVLCDDTGWAHLISRSWNITSFKAYELSVSLAQQLPHDPYLVTIGDDETGINPMIRVWDWSRNDRHGNPINVKVSRAVPSHMRPTLPTALAVHDHKNLLAVGFQDGSVTVFRGDITRQRSGKMKTLPDSGTSPITGLAFQGTDKLFVVCRSCVMVYWLNNERCQKLDTMGAAPRCSVLADKHRLTIATSDAIYCYTCEGRGPCYALEGEKVRLDWFRSYLVITTNEPIKYTNSTSNPPASKNHHVTILDIQNKVIVFSKTFDEIDAVLTEWGSFYILTKNKEMIYLDEKDLQSKLSLLFKKNLYDVAIWIASNHHYDSQGLTEIHKQYADHLFNKGDLKGAIEQYIKTIGWLETSYVIRKYLESRHLEPLVQYLEELHKKGGATEDHTTLLLTCYVKIDQHDQQGKLKEFINSTDKVFDIDVDLAIKVVRQVSIDDALLLASNNKRHDWYLKIVIEDKKDYKKALDYIAELEFEDAEIYMKKYGHGLLQHETEESTKFLILLCSNYKPRSEPLVDESTLSGIHREPNRALPDDFIHMFLSNSEKLIEFLEKMIEFNSRCSKLVYNVLIEHYIHVWVKSSDEKKSAYEDKIMKILKDPESNYDKDQTLIICQMLGFKPGMLYLYEENKLWREQMIVQLRAGCAAQAQAVCERRGGSCPTLWLELLWWPPPRDLLPDLLTVIAKENLLSPILVVDCLTSTPSYTLGDVRKYLMDVLTSENEVITREQELASKYKSESEKMKAQIQMIQNEPVVFQSSKCAACNRPLELPSVHFLCQHSYHQHCFQSYSDSESECPACSPRVTPVEPPRADTLHHRLLQQHDAYAVVSEYFGRGLFNKVTVITESGLTEEPPLTSEPQPAPSPVASLLTQYVTTNDKLRLQEGPKQAMKQPASKGATAVQIPDGRLRFLEQQQYSSSLEANITKIQPETHSAFSSIALKRRDDPKALGVDNSPKISSVISNSAGKNPFEEENYDESKNPFSNDDINDPTNPFAEDDYDKNLNPFS